MIGGGLKMGSFHLFRHPKWSRIISGTPFLTHFLSQNDPFSRHLGMLGGPQRAAMSSKRARNTCLGIPCGPLSFLKKLIFFCTRWTLLTHFGTHLFGLPLAACRSPLGLGTGV